MTTKKPAAKHHVKEHVEALADVAAEIGKDDVVMSEPVAEPPPPPVDPRTGGPCGARHTGGLVCDLVWGHLERGEPLHSARTTW